VLGVALHTGRLEKAANLPRLKVLHNCRLEQVVVQDLQLEELHNLQKVLGSVPPIPRLMAHHMNCSVEVAVLQGSEVHRRQ
jgi:hypothetical protein